MKSWQSKSCVILLLLVYFVFEMGCVEGNQYVFYLVDSNWKMARSQVSPI